MTAELKNIILSNTNIKLVGMNSGETPVIMSKETGADLEDLRDLQRGEFIARIGAGKPFKFRARIDYLNHSRSISDDEFEAIRQHQLKHYYVLPKEEYNSTAEFALSCNDW